MYHNNCAIHFHPGERIIEKNLLYLETLLNGLIKNMNHDPSLSESSERLKREKKNMMNSVDAMKRLLASSGNPKDNVNLNKKVIMFIDRIRDSKLFRTVMTNTLDRDIKLKAHLFQNIHNYDK